MALTPLFGELSPNGPRVALSHRNQPHRVYQGNLQESIYRCHDIPVTVGAMIWERDYHICAPT